MAWKEKLQNAWDENPLAVIAIGAMAVTAVSKLYDAHSAAQSRKAYARQIQYKLPNGGRRRF